MEVPAQNPQGTPSMQEFLKLQQEVLSLKKSYDAHKHNNRDGTKGIDGEIRLLPLTLLKHGKVNHLDQTDFDSDRDFYYVSVGPDAGNNFGDTTKNAQLNIEHQNGTNGGTNSSFYYGFRPPLYFQTGGIQIVSGRATLTDPQQEWEVNALAGALINLYDSTHTFKQTRTIVSNIEHTITVDSNFTFSDSSGDYLIFMPMYFGSAEYPWRRLYTTEGDAGGVRFGVGPTAGGQNGMLYMDAAGDLYWRNKTGTVTKLN